MKFQYPQPTDFPTQMLHVDICFIEAYSTIDNLHRSCGFNQKGLAIFNYFPPSLTQTSSSKDEKEREKGRLW